MTEQAAILQFIEQCWKTLPLGFAAPLVWVRQYPPVSNEVDMLADDLFPQRTWVLDDKGLREENVWKWERLATVRWRQPYCRRMWEASSADHSKPPEMAFTSFARYEDTPQFYLEMIWGRLFAEGLRVFVQDNSVQIERKLWLS